MPRSVVEDAADNPFGLIVAVREFVEAMVSQGLYRSTEISPKAMQACHADDYLAEVNNGGHSQFIYNSGEELDTVIADARTALVGKRLGRVEAQAIETVLELAAAYHAPVAVDLLLRRAGFDPTDAVVSANSVVPREGGAVVNWVVMADEHVFLLQSTLKGGVLRGTHEESLAEADRRELEEYFDQAAAAGA
ncbi:hypothetical protein [Mesorhizobium sp. M1348]|uniref:DMP19 family protein n=1 Tax=unclassified Mesorhizobium TaxID=325217 RepID=UPI00333A5143